MFVVAALGCAVGLAHAAADAPTADAERARLRAEYERTRFAGPACELAELERRAGRLDEAARLLDEVIARFPHGVEGADLGRPEAFATMSACRYNRAHVHEDRGELERAYALYGRATDTPNERRRAVVEGAILRVASRRAQTSECASLRSSIEARALLRFGDDAVLRRCVRTMERTERVCRSLRGAALASATSSAYAHAGRDGVAVGCSDDGLVVARSEAPIGGVICEPLGTAAMNATYLGTIALGSTSVVAVGTTESFSYSCDCPEEEAEFDGEESDEFVDCRCRGQLTAAHLVGMNGRHLMSVVAEMSTWDGEMITPEWVVPGTHSEWGALVPPTLDGDVLVFLGRRLVLRDGMLVPAN